MIDEIHRSYHEASAIFPLLEGAEFEALKADIAANGLIEPICLHPDGSVLDGRNRHRACIETEIEPRFKTWDSRGSPMAFVVSMNLHRRHLNETQRATVATKIANMHQGARTDLEPSANLQKVSRAEAAKMLNVSPRTVATVAKIEREAPDLIPEMEAGNLTAHAATKKLRQRQYETMPKPELPKGKYRVIYADPPWQYDNSGLAQSAARHYLTMSQEELCALPTGELAYERSVLFLWATSPLLPEALEVMEAWGFKYKASRVWIKNKSPGIGWFIKTRHEFLLIGVRGNGMHPSQKLDSIFECPVTRHSEKPQKIYEDIESSYEGPYIELFARNKREGWETWGDEI